MVKSYVGNKQNTLVIVESPAKCSKIESYLGPGYTCVASFGHLRNLQSLEDIDIANGFRVTYRNDEKKQFYIEQLRKKINESDEVILATDDDREGEAIAWHICDIFQLPIATTKRIVFHEITETAIQKALEQPRIIDMNIVQSQQARQILDLLVGYKISPLLWKYITKKSKTALSAGRCQSPALKLIYENQMEIDASPGKQIYKTTGYFTNAIIPFELNHHYETPEEMSDFLENSVNTDHLYSRTEPKKVYKHPPEPLTTSRIQQLISNEMRLSPKDTMKCCQLLYENGYITYMRTDSKKYSADFLFNVKQWIVQEYNDQRYIHPEIDLLSNSREERETKTETEKETKTKPNKTSNKVKTKEKEDTVNHAQEAHEAIRPTNIQMKSIPDKEKNLFARERKIYQLIWLTTLQSCMSPAEYYSITASLISHNNTKFIYTSELLDFPGYQIVNPPKDEKNHYSYLMQLKPGSVFEYKKIISNVTLTNTKQHYTEAKLVQLLEEKGIGRPSTFSSLVEKIQEREYVKKENVVGKEIVCTNFELENDELTEKQVKKEFGNEKEKLVLQPLGKIVMEFLDKNCNEFLNYDYTSHMETDLDAISTGVKNWLSLCITCLDDLSKMIERITSTEKKYEIQLDESHVYKIGKYGPIIQSKDANGKTIFEKARTDLDPAKIERGEYSLEEIIEPKMQIPKDSYFKNMGTTFEGSPLLVKKGKYGLYASWGEKTKSLSSLGNRPMENISLEEVLGILENTDTTPKKFYKNYKKYKK
jgi:DNA topoisomerase I